MIIRKAGIDDISQITQLFKAAVEQTNSKDYNEVQIQAWAAKHALHEMWQYKLERDHFLVAEDNRQLCGFSSITMEAYIDFLFVHPDLLRKGIAGQLLERIFLYANEMNFQTLTVHASITALPFFLSQGFEILKEDSNSVNGIKLKNYLMKKEQVQV